MVLQSLIQSSAYSQHNTTRFCIVRFGNVLGSSGSVIPKFREQIRQGGPISVTHPRVTRYFMTISEAAQLVIQASAIKHQDNSRVPVYLLDMGESVMIADLAKSLVQLSGLTVRDEENPEGDISIEFTGLRVGEKLYEELLVDGSPLATEHPRIWRSAETEQSRCDIVDMVEDLRTRDWSNSEIRHNLFLLDIGYTQTLHTVCDAENT
jgi:FlaA1/EpsC-like NDP-sugar epimerase